jgi:hypothetical protein
MQAPLCLQPFPVTFSHFWGRSNKATRYDFDNCDAVHDECHAIWEADKHGDYKVWKFAQLGKARYEALERRARLIIKFGAFEEAQKLKELKSYGIVASPEIS